jgi:hypothetical protein
MLKEPSIDEELSKRPNLYKMLDCLNIMIRDEFQGQLSEKLNKIKYFTADHQLINEIEKFQLTLLVESAFDIFLQNS